MKHILIIIAFFVVSVSVNAIPPEIKNDNSLIKINGIILQKTNRYDFRDDSVKTFCCLVDSIGFDKNGKMISYYNFFPYGKVKVNEKYMYTDFDSLKYIVSNDDDGQPKSIRSFEYVFENNLLVEKRNMFADNSVEERSVFYYDKQNKISNIIVYDEEGGQKNYIFFSYQNGKLIKRSKLDRTKKTVENESFEYNENGKCVKNLLNNFSSNTSKRKEIFYDNAGRFIKIIESNDHAEEFTYQINYLENGLISNVMVLTKSDKPIYMLEYVYLYEFEQRNH